MNYILENTEEVEFFTYLTNVFKSIDNIQNNYNWLITDFECNYTPNEKLKGDIAWFTGEELTELVENNDIQFIWGVLSGFPKSYLPDMKSLNVVPYADSNVGLWSPHVQIQHPMAEIEIICWDSSATLLLSLDERISNLFSSYYSDACDLNKLNLVSFVKRVKGISNIYPVGSMKRNSPHYRFISYMNQGVVMYLAERFDEVVIFFRRAIKAKKSLIYSDNDKKFYQESYRLIKYILWELSDYSRISGEISKLNKKLLEEIK